VSGEHIKLANARIDASGRAGGGKVLIGGDWRGGNPNKNLVSNPSAKLETYAIPTATTVSVDAGTRISASATGRGNGGKVVLWSDSETTFAGTILARGGAKSGDGGFAEVSSHRLLNYSGTTDTRARKGSVGTLLLDPLNVLISPQASSSNISFIGGTFAPTGQPSVLSDKQLSDALLSSNVIVTTGGADSPGSQVGDITLRDRAHVVWSTATTLMLSAYHDIVFQPGSFIKNDATAPGARLLAVHAFSTATPTAESTSFNILKGVDWSVRQGARIINMSFAGPKDPSLERVLKLAYDKGIVLIAAAGNAGPKSPPLYPGADPNVIAVTATDVDDKLFTGANRGKYISVAAPGVDILVPAPEGEYQITTGTSVAAAEVSGIVALLLERNPKLTPADVRRILTVSAKRLGPGERNDNFGSGLIDPFQALQLADQEG
jgi:hypothetical protein